MQALERAAAKLPRHEDRPEQRTMAEAVTRSIKQNRHLVVQAGTGTGKSLAYLVPALALGTRVVVSTATKALQDQLSYRDLPQLSRSLGVPFQFAVLKGRSNYICRQRVKELSGEEEQLVLDHEDGRLTTDAKGKVRREVERLVSWAVHNGGRRRRKITGDRAELPWEPSEAAWAQVSTGWRECPGASLCPSGGECFAEKRATMQPRLTSSWSTPTSIRPRLRSRTRSYCLRTTWWSSTRRMNSKTSLLPRLAST